MSGGPPLLRRINEAAVLTALRESGPMRLAELVRRTGLSRPTVGMAVTSLASEGWIEFVDVDAGPRTLGRPARIVRFRASAGNVLGLDIGPHKVLAVLADLVGTVVAERRHDARDVRTRRELLGHVRAAVREVLRAAGVRRDAVRAVVAGTPGIVDVTRGSVLQAPNLPGWTSIELAGELRRSFDCPVHVENDVNLAVLAERWMGAAREAETLVFVQWGARVGAGIMIGDRLHRGADGAAGEVGFLTVGGSAPELVDRAGLGPFERAVGASAIADLARTAARRADGRVLRAALADRAGAPDVAAVFAAAERGDAAARSVVDEISARFAEGLAPLLLVLNPDAVVIGGGISRAGPALLEAINRHVESRSLVQPRLSLSALGDEAVAFGAVRLALTDAERRLFPSAIGEAVP